ncbi:MAG: hypothetical protein COA54_04995 [Thiotrichaceae bacterium]|nr:MAG: hypothetical protein COA54_04995 [Thiotrichaceae bacterium]
MSLNRRHFLKYLSLGCATPTLTGLMGCTHQKFYNPDQDIILGGGSYQQDDILKYVLAIANLQKKDKQLIDMDFLAHGIIIDPNDKKRLLVFEKNGPGAAEIDLSNLSVSKKIAPSKDKHFYGHGTFNQAGDTLYCTETNLNNQKGALVIRDAHDFNVLGEFPTYGENPHECQLIDDGATLLVTHAGSVSKTNSAPSVTYIDVASKKLKERINLANEPLTTAHTGIANDGSLVVASTPGEGLEKTHTGGVSIRSGNQPILSMTQPEVVINQMNGEALSVIIDNNRRIAAVTHPKGNMVTFWSIDKRELLKAMSVPKPAGVTLSLDEKSFIVSYGVNTSLILINTKDLNARTDSIFQPTYLSGSHIYNWSKILTEIMPTNVYS